MVSTDLVHVRHCPSHRCWPVLVLYDPDFVVIRILVESQGLDFRNNHNNLAYQPIILTSLMDYGNCLIPRHHLFLASAKTDDALSHL